jgi:hypothetical protein
LKETGFQPIRKLQDNERGFTGAGKRAEATSEAQKNVSPDSERPRKKPVGSPPTSFSAACLAARDRDST